MSRSAIWCAAYVAAWQRNRQLRVFAPGPPRSDPALRDPGEPLPRGEVARLSAREADECEAGYLEAFGRDESE